MLKRRILSGIVLVALSVAALYTLPGIALLALALVFCALGQWEFFGLRAMPRPDRLNRTMALIAGSGWILSVYLEPLGLSPEFLAVFGAATVMLLLMLSLRGGNGTSPNDTAWVLLSLFYVPLLLSFMLRLIWADISVWPEPAKSARLSLLFMLAVVKGSDMGAYAVGMTLGRTPLCPRLSPAKTREGLAGGLLTGLLVAWGLAGIFSRIDDGFHLPTHDALTLGLLLSLAGVVGDLTESRIKRAAGAKDSGRWVPGMGGLLDVLDSLLFAAPLYFVYLRIRGL